MSTKLKGSWSYLFLPIALLGYIVYLIILIISVIGISITLEKQPIKLFKKLHHAMLVPQRNLRI